MERSHRDIDILYRQVSAEYNETPLAVEHGWVHYPTGFGTLEMCAITRFLPAGGCLIDIGTGTGIVPRFARKLGIRVVSIDTPVAGTAALDNVRQAGVETRVCDVEREALPVESCSADGVFFGDVIEHLLHSPKPVLQEIFRVLKPGGVCIATTPNAVRLTVRLRMLLGLSNWADLGDFFDAKHHGGHHHEYTLAEFRSVFERTGFRVLDLTLFEESLRSVRLARLSDVRTQDRSRALPWTEPLGVRAGKRLLLGVTWLSPHLRSNMLLIAAKPAA